MKRIALPVLVLLLAAAGITYLATRGDSDAADAPPMTDAAATAADPSTAPTILRGAPTEALPARLWEPGVRRRYDVDTERSVSLAFGEGRGAAGTYVLGGQLALTPLAVEGDNVFVHGRLAEPRFSVTGDDEGLDGLDSEFVVNYRKDGRLEAVLYPRGLDARTRNQLSWLVAALQQVAPADAMAASWTATEVDQTGTYETLYQRGADATRQVVKQKQRYTDLADPDAAASPDDYAVAGEQVATLDDRGWFETLRGAEQARVETTGVVLAIDATVAATLAGTDDAADLVARADELLAGMVADDLAAEVGLEDLRDDLDRQLVGGRSVAELLAEIRDADSDKRNQLLFATAAALRLDPDGVPAVAAAVRGLEPGEAANIMLGSLGASGVAAAQDALGDLLSDEDLAPAHRLSATAALAQSASHTDESVDALRDAAAGESSNVQRAATLALGAAARASDDGAALVKELLEQLASAASVEDRVLLLGALGNTGHVDALPALLTATNDADARVRREAVEALRFMDDGRADARIDQALTGDPDAAVRGAALFAIAFRSLAQHLPALEQVARADADAGVRRALVGLLEPQLAVPGARAILSFLAENDADADVRAAATAALAG